MGKRHPSGRTSAEKRQARRDPNEALAQAVQLHRAGRLSEALDIYRDVLAAHPSHPDALHFAGVLAHQAGESEHAERMIRRAIEISPTHADAHNNLGNVLKEQGKLDEAAAAYRQAVALNPVHADAYNNLGTVLNAQARLEEAVAAYEHAIALNPAHADAYLNLGNVYKKQGKVDATIQAYLKTISLKRYSPAAYRNLGTSLYCEGRVEEAARVYAAWLRYEPDHPVALHMQAACSGRDVPARASDEYVRSVFNRFAESFDRQLEKLEYHAPQLVADALIARLGEPAQQCDVLDAGCGTGLCGPLLRPYARRLIGVDLSPAMLEKARGRGVYDELSRGELTEYMSGCFRQFDVIASADTLVYFGRLGPAFAAAATALRPGGHLVFSVESVADGEAPSGFRLNPHGRYSHSERYLRRTLEESGFTVQSVTGAVLRTEKLEPVAGFVVVARR